MDYLTIKELVLEIVEEILSSDEDLQELFVRRRKSAVPKKRGQYPQKVDRHKYVKQFRPFATRGGVQIDARYVRRGGPTSNPLNPVRPPRP
jgi:hypothetical protein